MKNSFISPTMRKYIFHIALGTIWVFALDITLPLLIKNKSLLLGAQITKDALLILVIVLIVRFVIERSAMQQRTSEEVEREAEERYRDLVEKLPAAVFMDRLDDTISTQYISPRIKELLGYTQEEWEVREHLWEESIHPEDRERVLAEDRRTNQTGEPFRIEYRLRHRDGHYVWVKEDAYMVKREDAPFKFWHGILVDIDNQKKAEENVKKRDSILKAVGYAAGEFLKSSDWGENINIVLEMLGKATQVSRAYIFKKKDGEGKVYVSQLFEWSKEGIHSQIDNPILTDLEITGRGFSRWEEHFQQGQPIYGNIKDFPSEEHALLEVQGIISLVCIPIPVKNTWWGFIGFDECEVERVWTDIEIEALQTAARTLGAAINRRSSEEILQSSEYSYKGLFNAVQDGIFIQDKNGIFLDVNDGAASMYGHPREYFHGKNHEFFSAPGLNDQYQIASHFQQAFDGTPQEFDFWGVRSNGEIFPQEVRLFKGFYFGQEAVIAVAQDITSRKMAEEALQKQLRELSVLHAAALTESAARDVDTLIQQVTNIIGDTLYSDNCGVLLFDEANNRLIPHFSYRGVDIQKQGHSISADEGVSGKVIASRRAVCIGDISRETAYVQIDQNTRSELCVPIASGTNIYGVLNVESKKLNAFSERDEKLLGTIAGGLANAIERIQLYELEKQQREQAEVLREATIELVSLLEPEKIFETIFTSLARLVPYDSASIELTENNIVTILAGKNIPADLIGQQYQFEVDKWGPYNDIRSPILIPDVRNDERFTVFEETSRIRSWMGIPLLIHGKTVGFLNLDSHTVGYFTTAHASLAQTFGNQAAIAIENSRLFHLEQQRREIAETLRLATASLANTLDINDLFENILNWAQQLAPYDSASLVLFQGNTLRLSAQRNLPPNFAIGYEFPYTEKWEAVSESRQPLILKDAQTDDLFEKWEGSEYIHGWMSVSMFVQDALIGFLNLDSRTIGAFTEDHVVPIQTFANQAAVAIENTRLFELEKQRRQTANTVLQAAMALTNPLDIESLHAAILDWLYRITPYDSASIMEIENEAIHVTAARGLPDIHHAKQQTFSPDNELCKLINSTGRALVLEDCWNDPRFEKWADSDYVRGWMGVPLASRGQVIGYITMDSRQPGAFSQHDANAVQTFAQQAATSLENVRLYTETRQRLEELEIISRVSSALRTARNTGEMIPILLDEIKTSLGTDAILISLYDQESNTLQPKVAGGVLADMPKRTFKPGEGIVGSVFAKGAVFFSAELGKDPQVHHENKGFYGSDWKGLVVPIRTTTETIGTIMAVAPSGDAIESHHIRLVTTLAEIAGNAIHRSTLYERSEEQVRRLTTLREMDAAITSSLDLRITLNIITEHLLKKMGADAAAILVFNPESQMLEYFAASGFENREATRGSISIGDTLAGRILLSRRAIHIKDIKSAEELQVELLPAAGDFSAYYAVPLFSKGVTKGILETYFKQPFAPNADWADFLETLAGQASIAIDNAQLFESLQRTNQEISLAYDTTLEGWGKALELRDKETQGHTKRVTNLTMELARQMGIRESELVHFRRGALLHDIGKMGVPDNILRKTGPLTKDEMDEMRKHPQYAYDLLSPIPYLRPALDIAYCHHEWWNGNGYPRGLRDVEIPLSARIFAVVDVWDALLSDRPYREAWPEEKVMEYIDELSGKQFDPAVVAVFQDMVKTEHKFIVSNYPRKTKLRRNRKEK